MKSNAEREHVMIDGLIVTTEASQDFDEAYAWYELQQVGLGEEFLRCVEACIERICRLPNAYEKIEKDYRRAIVRRFPYAIVYEHAKNAVTIYSIFHTSQDPKKWRRRLG